MVRVFPKRFKFCGDFNCLLGNCHRSVIVRQFETKPGTLKKKSLTIYFEDESRLHKKNVRNVLELGRGAYVGVIKNASKGLTLVYDRAMRMNSDFHQEADNRTR